MLFSEPSSRGKSEKIEGDTFGLTAADSHPGDSNKVGSGLDQIQIVDPLGQ